ncbi:hypothetical protein HF086_008147 [Spodoptera exigua]|uniref:Transposase n=1 Tax=Spodoptera exigua TaxID=7107 RepID=A0A922M406_SPOEX|nr:hypothetical protein HF086_008147 [Spodoptera exigua]
MSTWRSIDQKPWDFHEALYGWKDVEVKEEMPDEHVESVDDDEDETWEGSLEQSCSVEAASYPPLSSIEGPTKRLPGTEPVVPDFGENDQPLNARDVTKSAGTIDTAEKIEVEVDLDAYLSPDAHAYRSSGVENDSEKNDKECSERQKGRSGVRGRGHSSRGRRAGHPLNETLNDEDMSPELVSMATDALQRRQMMMQGSAKTGRNNDHELDRDSENEDEFFDANCGEDNLSKLNRHFEWSTMESFQCQAEIFKPERTGSVWSCNSAYDAFRSYWRDDVLAHIVAEINTYATKLPAAFQSEWYPTNIHEILCLFSFWIMLGIVRMPTVVSCFSVDPLMKTEVFRRIFTRRRYEMLSKVFHFIDSDPAVNQGPSNIGDASNFDHLYRLRPIILHLNYYFQANYTLHKDICIDESLTLCKGRLNFIQDSQNKVATFAIKTFELCESSTGYLWSFIVNADKQFAPDLGQSPGLLRSTKAVKQLISPLLNKGYRLFMNNWYNSPLLARFLKLNGTDFVGTLRPSCKDVPEVINKAPLKKGELIARHSGDVSILSWQDTARVTMISTCHGSDTALPTVSSCPSNRQATYKPQVVLDYKRYMRSVDLKDQLLEPYLEHEKRGAKWSMKLFKRLLNISILNARVLLESSTEKRHDHLAFRLSLVDSILTLHLAHCPKNRKFNVSSSKSSRNQPQNIQQTPFTHWPVLLERSGYTAARNRNFRKRCFVCLREGRKTQTTPYCCEVCQVPLCITNCFKSYHTPMQ